MKKSFILLFISIFPLLSGCTSIRYIFHPEEIPYTFVEYVEKKRHRYSDTIETFAVIRLNYDITSTIRPIGDWEQGKELLAKVCADIGKEVRYEHIQAEITCRHYGQNGCSSNYKTVTAMCSN